MAKKVHLTEDEIKQAKISDNFREAVFAAYEYAKTDEDGYFFKEACITLKYIIGITDINPRTRSGIEYDNLVDKSAQWSEVDNRIIHVILDENRNEGGKYRTRCFYKVASWLTERIEKM